jgi:hypothetical protein
MKTTQTLFAALVFSVGSVSFGADSPGLSYVQGAGAYGGSPGPGGASAGGYTFGWAFRPSVDITVTALGFPDSFAPGLLLSHTIFLWDGVTQDVLRTALAPAGANPGGTAGANDFRYYSVTPVTLTAGRTYVVGAGYPAVGDLEPSDLYYSCHAAASITFDSRITWLDGGVSGALNSFPNQWRGTGSAGKISLGTCNFLIAPPPPACVGDLNGDRVVNTADLVTFLGAFGQSASPAGSGADFVADGVVNTADLVFFLGRFGTACP